MATVSARTGSRSLRSVRMRIGAVALLLLAGAGCTHGSPQDAARPGGEDREGGTGTRAKGEEKALAPSAPLAENERYAVAPTARRDAPSPVAPAAPTQAPAKPDATKEFGMGGLGLSGIGQGGGGRALPASPGFGAGHGRLSGSHATSARPLVPAPARASSPDFNTEAYSRIHDNPFLAVSDQPLSTFSVDVDTASYSNARRFLNDGQKPPKDAIRIEEWVNYFAYDYPEPAGDEPFSITSDVATCPWNPEHKLVRIGLKSKALSQEATPPRNLVFLVDVSGSMMPPNRLPLLKRGLELLTRNLRKQDSLSIVVYAGASGLALPATSGADQGRILTALSQLEAGGSTNGADGIRLAYDTARQHFIENGINRVLLATDGDFNVGTTSQGELERLIETECKSGVFLTVLGFGNGNLKDATMEALADKGNGNYAYIDSLAEARKVLVREAGATLVTVAKDVKLQVEFNPTRVQGYKLIGYEDRLLAKEDFNDDKKDAGDVGAGHSVTALYELIPKSAKPLPAKTDPLKYQTNGAPAAAADSDELMTVNIRFKQPTSDTSSKLSRVVRDSALPFAQTSADFRFGVAVAEAALVLRGAADLHGASLDTARALASDALGRDPSGDRHEFISLLAKARTLTASNP